VVSDIGLRLQEGIQELKLEQQLAPAREAVARTLTVGSSNFFKAVEGVKGRWIQRAPSLDDNIDSQNKLPRTSTPPVEVSKADWEEDDCRTATLAGPDKRLEAAICWLHLLPMSKDVGPICFEPTKCRIQSLEKVQT
jgi:dipeptidyl aminopeptidase/acylaminoacyl peptidase